MLHHSNPFSLSLSTQTALLPLKERGLRKRRKKEARPFSGDRSPTKLTRIDDVHITYMYTRNIYMATSGAWTIPPRGEALYKNRSRAFTPTPARLVARTARVVNV